MAFDLVPVIQQSRSRKEALDTNGTYDTRQLTSLFAYNEIDILSFFLSVSSLRKLSASHPSTFS